MIFYIDVKTDSSDLMFESIEFITEDGTIITSDWDESEILRTDYGFSARYKGVYFDDEYANGKFQEIANAKIHNIQAYCEDSKPTHFEIISIDIFDNEYHSMPLNDIVSFDIIHEIE